MESYFFYKSWPLRANKQWTPKGCTLQYLHWHATANTVSTKYYITVSCKCRSCNISSNFFQQSVISDVDTTRTNKHTHCVKTVLDFHKSSITTFYLIKHMQHRIKKDRCFIQIFTRSEEKGTNPLKNSIIYTNKCHFCCEKCLKAGPANVHMASLGSSYHIKPPLLSHGRLLHYPPTLEEYT